MISSTGPRRGVEAGEQRKRLAHREQRVELARLQHETEPIAPRARRRRGIDAEHGDVAAGPRAVALEDLDRRGLARAVRPEKAEHLAGRDLEVDAAHGFDRAVTHAEVAHLDRGTHSSASAMLRAVPRLPSRPMHHGRRAQFGLLLGICALAASVAACSSTSGSAAAPTSTIASTTTRVHRAAHARARARDRLGPAPQSDRVLARSRGEGRRARWLRTASGSRCSARSTAKAPGGSASSTRPTCATWSPMTVHAARPDASRAKRHPTSRAPPTARSSSPTSRSCTTARGGLVEALLPHHDRLRALLAAQPLLQPRLHTRRAIA